MSASDFDRDYYENGLATGRSCYTDYRWMPELTVPMVEALIKNLGIRKTQMILDFGCAKGYVVKAFRGLGYNAWGCDISTYALSQADAETSGYLYSGYADFYSWILAKDVLEHTSEQECRAILAGMREKTNNLFIAVPLGNNGQYTIPEMELDVTHKIRRPLWWWTSEVEAAGFKVKSATFSMPGIKENWTRRWKFGNGFIICE